MLHAEAVLLVDHDQAEVGRLHALLEHGVGADQQVDAAAHQVEQHPLGVGGGRRAGEQLHARAARGVHAQRRQQAGERALVLLGQDRRRHHEHRLAAVLDDRQHRPRRDQGLAGADVALQQPVHRLAARQVGVELREGPQLVGGGRERQAGDEPLHEAARLRGLLEPDGLRLQAVAALLQAQLQREQLVVDQPAPCGRDVAEVLRAVDRAHRPVAGLQRPGGAQLLRERVGQGSDGLERGGDQRRDARRREALGRRVDDLDRVALACHVLGGGQWVEQRRAWRS